MILKKLLNLLSFEPAAELVASYDVQERYISHQWFKFPDMVVDTEEIISCEELTIYVDSETTDYEYTTTTKLINANGDVIGYRYDRTSERPEWVEE
jgi:hypothetical protein